MVDVEFSDDRVAVIGAGAVGGAVLRALRAGGYDVLVWNRTPGRSDALGATPAGSIREAASSSGLILLTVSDHVAVRECLDALGTDPLPGRTVVALTTGTAGDAQAAAERVAGLGARYLGAGIQASADAIGTDAATILYGGSRAAYERHSAALGLLGTPRYVGEAPEAAAVWDLALFGLWYDAQLGLLRALDTVRAAGIDVADFAELASTQLGHVVAAVPGTVTELRQATYPPGPASLAEHLPVVRRLVELRAGRQLGDGGLADLAARIETLVAAGRGGEGLTAVVG